MKLDSKGTLDLCWWPNLEIDPKEGNRVVAKVKDRLIHMKVHQGGINIVIPIVVPTEVSQSFKDSGKNNDFG